MSNKQLATSTNIFLRVSNFTDILPKQKCTGSNFWKPHRISTEKHCQVRT